MGTLKQIEDAIYDYTYAQSVGDTPKFSLTQIGELAKTLTESGVTADEINSVRTQAETSALEKADKTLADQYSTALFHWFGDSVGTGAFSSGADWNIVAGPVPRGTYQQTLNNSLTSGNLAGKEIIFGAKAGTPQYDVAARVFDEATKYVYASGGVIDKNTRYDNRYGTVDQLEQSLKDATSAATQAGVSPVRLKHLIELPAKRVEKYYSAPSISGGLVNLFKDLWKPFDTASKFIVPVVSTVWGSVLAGPAGLGLSGATGAAVGGAISGGIKSAILDENILEGALEGAAVAGLTNVALSATGLDKVLSDAVNKVDETLGISEKTNALLANTPQGVEEANALADLGVSDLGASDVAGNVADVDVSAGEFFDEPFIGDELLSPTNLDNAYASLSDYGRTVYDAEIALGSTPEMAYIRAARANAMYFPETGNALATGGAAAAGNALATDQTPYTMEDLSPNVGGAIDFTQGAAVTPPGGVATVVPVNAGGVSDTLSTGMQEELGLTGAYTGGNAAANAALGLGAAGTAAGVAGAGAAAGAAGAGGQMTAADLAGLDPNLTLGGGTDVLGGTDVTGGTGAIVTGAAGGAGAGAITAGGAAAAGLTGIPVVDDFLKYLGTPAGAAALGAFGSLASGYLTGQAAKDAANIQAQSAANALALQEKQFEYQKELLDPYRRRGESALNRLAGVMGLDGQPAQPQQLLEMDPGYAFRLGEGMKALERVQAARGNMLSGGAIKAGQRYAQDFASGEYGNAYNRLANIAGLGQTVGGQLGSAAQQFGQTAGDTMSQSANALAAGRVGRMSGYMGGIGGAVGAYQNYQNQQQQNQLFRDIYGRMGG